MWKVGSEKWWKTEASKRKRGGERSNVTLGRWCVCVCVSLRRGGWTFIPSFGCIPDCLFFFLTSRLTGPKSCLLPAWSKPNGRWLREPYTGCHFSLRIPLTGGTESKLAYYLETAETNVDLHPHMSPAWEPTGRNFSQRSTRFYCGNLWVEIQHFFFFFLAQWTWGATGNIPCGTIGYQKSLMTTPCSSDMNEPATGYTTEPAEVSFKKNLACGFSNWVMNHDCAVTARMLYNWLAGRLVCRLALNNVWVCKMSGKLLEFPRNPGDYMKIKRFVPPALHNHQMFSLLSYIIKKTGSFSTLED